MAQLEKVLCTAKTHKSNSRRRFTDNHQTEEVQNE